MVNNVDHISLFNPSAPNQQPKGGEARKKDNACMLG